MFAFHFLPKPCKLAVCILVRALHAVLPLVHFYLRMGLLLNCRCSLFIYFHYSSLTERCFLIKKPPSVKMICIKHFTNPIPNVLKDLNKCINFFHFDIRSHHFMLLNTDIGYKSGASSDAHMYYQFMTKCKDQTLLVP